MRRAFLFVCMASLLISAPAPAQNGLPDTENGRYSFNQTPEGLLRLDGRTGHVSLCSKRALGWSCTVVPDERTALETEIARLQNETATLKKELISRGISLPSGVKASEKATEKQGELILKLPSEAEFDRVMGFMEKVWRRFLEVVQNMQKELEKKS